MRGFSLPWEQGELGGWCCLGFPSWQSPLGGWSDGPFLVGLVAGGTRSGLGDAAGLSQRVSLHRNSFSSDGALSTFYSGHVPGLRESAHTADTWVLVNTETHPIIPNPKAGFFAQCREAPRAAGSIVLPVDPSR